MNVIKIRTKLVICVRYVYVSLPGHTHTHTHTSFDRDTFILDASTLPWPKSHPTNQLLSLIDIHFAKLCALSEHPSPRLHT